MSGSGDGHYDKIHKVKGVVDDYNILIEARSSSDEVVYDLVVFKLVSVKFNTEAEWVASDIAWVAGMKAYIDYGDTEGTWKIITYVPDATIILTLLRDTMDHWLILPTSIVLQWLTTITKT
jgi:hypothetical protein